MNHSRTRSTFRQSDEQRLHIFIGFARAPPGKFLQVLQQ
jgi:hypothetical protein